MAKKVTPRVRDAEGTKATILTAARERFAADGYERATIRAIAGDAKIDPALVMRYFGNKEKLFAAAANFDLGLPDLATLPRHCAGAALVEHFVERWERDDTFMALLRAAATNDAAAKQVRSVLGGQVAPVIAQLSGEPEQAATRAGLVSSQILGMALCRYVLRLPPLVAMTRSEIVAWLGPTLQRYITGGAGAAADW
jgi:AcrR family transcriptional regulator